MKYMVNMGSFVQNHYEQLWDMIKEVQRNLRAKLDKTSGKLAAGFLKGTLRRWELRRL